MGTSTNGILVFGFNVCDEDDEPLPDLLDGYEDFDDLVRDEAGIPEWTENRPDGYFETVRQALAECPVTLVMHCSYNYPMYILAINGTKKTAHRGYPQEITQEELSVSAESIEKAKAWCAAHGIEWQEPKWLLCSLWG